MQCRRIVTGYFEFFKDCIVFLTFSLTLFTYKSGTVSLSLFFNLKLPGNSSTVRSKVSPGVSPELMNDIFHFVEEPYNLRNDYTSKRKRDHTVYHGSESLFSRAPKFCDLLPNSIKNSTSPKEFKRKINTWAFERCPCRICNKYVGRVGFI